MSGKININYETFSGVKKLLKIIIVYRSDLFACVEIKGEKLTKFFCK